MHKKRLKLFIFILSMTTYQHSFAHGGGGDGSSYEFDKGDKSAERLAEKKAAEKKQDADNWADFMKAVNTSSSDDHPEKSHNHGDSTSTE